MLNQLNEVVENKNLIKIGSIFLLTTIIIFILEDNVSILKNVYDIIVEFFGFIIIGAIAIFLFAIFDKKMRNRIISKILTASLIVTILFTVMTLIINVIY